MRRLLLLPFVLVLGCYDDAQSNTPGDGGDPCTGITGTCVSFVSGRDDETAVQNALAKATPATTFAFGKGTFKIGNTLTIATENATVRGQGIGETILDFTGQVGSEGISATKNGLLFEGFTVRNTKGDGIKVTGSTGVTFRKVRVEWTAGPRTTNGAYGFYPVESKNVLVDACESYGASDAGIYIGQSEIIEVKNSLVEANVAGIEIENSKKADVHNNTAKNNTAGILVFDMPNLPVKNGGFVRVFGNTVESNNQKNFAPAGNTVGKVPSGTGVLVMANHDVEVFENTLKDNGTINVGIVSYYVTEDSEGLKDTTYYPYPALVYVHDNVSTGGGTAPDKANPIGFALNAYLSTFPGGHIPDVVYDGIIDAARTGAKTPNPMDVCIRQATSGTFVDLRADQGTPFEKMSTDATPFACDLSLLPATVSPGAGR
jgi:parallel beta-helix repeat protein